MNTNSKFDTTQGLMHIGFEIEERTKHQSHKNVYL